MKFLSALSNRLNRNSRIHTEISTTELQIPAELILRENYWHAILTGDTATVKTLITNDLSLVNAKNEWHSSALYIAVEKGYEAIVDLLIEMKADVNAANAMGLTPLHIAAEKDVTGIFVKKLLEAGATESINRQNHHGNTPLHRAAESAINVNVRLLIAHGAKTDIRNRENMAAIDFPIVSEAQASLAVLDSSSSSYLPQGISAMNPRGADISRHSSRINLPSSTQSLTN